MLDGRAGETLAAWLGQDESGRAYMIPGVESFGVRIVAK
jgi:hypothetical protein